MGDYSALYFSDAKTPPGRGELAETSPYLLSKYHVPLFWLAMFDREDFSERKESDDPDEIWPYLAKKTIQAMASLEARRATLLSDFPRIDPIWLDQFVSLLAQTDFDYVHLDTRQIGGMNFTGPEWRESLESMLGIFETGPASQAGWRAFNSSFFSAYSGTNGTEPWSYCGASGTEELMPWELPD